ncbi:hypothetical protein [Alteribacillus bidgolensis]|uniref:hypothetical protein n=1 Tax=Alteribacillus bidgolensis TaxID=930129 RepID=UPI000B888BDA|nr:hypothetical protein [Alteribacillus bidgolensis]
MEAQNKRLSSCLKHVFSTVEEMNHHVSHHSEILRRGSTENDVLMFLAERSLTYPRTSWIKVKNIAAAVCKSIRTVGYALKSLEEKKIIQRIPVMRETKGGNSSNLIAILPFSPRVFRPSISYRSSPETADACLPFLSDGFTFKH